MKKRIDHLLSGKFHYDGKPLLFSKDQLEASLAPGVKKKEEVYVGTEDHRRIRGIVTSSHRRVVPGVSAFSGTTVRIPYEMDTTGMQEGDVCRGWLCFTTNVGEYLLPFTLEAAKSEVVTSKGELRTLDEFAAFAKENFREAYRLFTSVRFPEILRTATQKERALYAGFTSQPVTYQNLEEFLIACGRKEPVEVALKDPSREIFGLKSSVREMLRLTRKGWGHLRLEVETRGDFLEAAKHVITEEDFIGTGFVLEYLTHEEKLGRGRHCGEIRITGPYETLVYPVTVSRTPRSAVNVRGEERRRKAELLQDYLDFGCGRTTLKDWAASAHFQLNRLKEAGQDYPEYILYEAYVFLKEGRTEEALPVLASFRDKDFQKEDLEAAGLYLWLCTLAGLYKDREGALRRIEGFYRQKEESLWLLLPLLDLDSDYKTSDNNLLYALEEQFRKGSRSPLLYLKAWRLLEKNLNVFHRINSFWVQVFWFAGRNDLLNAESGRRFAYLVGYEKRWQEGVYQVLAQCCRQFAEDDEVEAICRYVMLGNPRRKEYFCWYEEAIKRGLRITRLYEYYMETLDLDRMRELPRSLLLYFSYNANALGDTRKARLYTSVLEKKDEEILLRYREEMKKFAKSALKKGRTGEDYSRLYQEFCRESETPEEANALASQLFTWRLYCDDPRMRSVIVLHPELAKEEVYPLVQGVAYPRLYTEDAVILFQDDRQRRFGGTIACNRRPLMEDRETAESLLKRGASSPGIFLYTICSRTMTRETLPVFGAMVEMDAFTRAFRHSICRKILEFYARDVRGVDLDLYLRQLDYGEYAQVDRTLLLEVLIDRGFYEEAFGVIREDGFEGLSAGHLCRLVSRQVVQTDYAREDELLSLAFQVYCLGVYDQEVLTFLMLHFTGPMEDMLRILESAKGFGLDTYAYEEHLLMLLCFLKDFRKEGEAVLESYVRKAGKERIIAAYLTHLSYGSLVREYPITEFTEKCLETAYVQQWPVDRICHLALFQALCKSRRVKPKQQALREKLLRECMEDHLVFAFYRKLPGELLSPYQLDDKTFVECHAAPGAKVELTYELDQGLGQKKTVQTEPLSPVYEGIYTKTITLFYGETLRYSFLIREGKKERRTTEKVVTMNRIEGEKGTKYLLLNEILSARKLGQTQKAAALLKTYLRKEQLVQTMFSVKEGRENE